MGLFRNEKGAAAGDDSDSDSGIITANASFSSNEALLCAVRGKIYAISKKDGSRLWRANFPSSSLGGIISIFITDTDKVIVGCNGKTACLDLYTGATKWLNKMPGCSIEEVAVACTPSRTLKPQIIPDLDETTGGPPAYEESAPEKQVVISCTYGKCLGIDIQTGEQLWKYNCPGGGINIPSVLTEPPSASGPHQRQVIYIGCGRHVYCLDSITGEEIWQTKVSNAKWGLGYNTMATAWSSRLAAESHTSFSNNPSAQQCSAIRNRNT